MFSAEKNSTSLQFNEKDLDQMISLSDSFHYMQQQCLNHSFTIFMLICYKNVFILWQQINLTIYNYKEK